MNIPIPAVSVYFVAGISVYRRSDMFHAAIQHIEKHYLQAGVPSVRTFCCYPYGTIDHIDKSQYGKFLAKQIVTVGIDLYRKPTHTTGGQALYQDIISSYDPSSAAQIVLIGHSGGGIASYKAAQLLERIGYPVRRIFMVGSPDIPIRATYKEKVFAIEHNGRWGDWISRTAYHWFRPAKVRVRLPLKGGHPFYFCPNSKDDSNLSNMEKVMGYICSAI